MGEREIYGSLGLDIMFRNAMRGQVCLAAGDEALNGEPLEVGVDPHRHNHHLPADSHRNVDQSDYGLLYLGWKGRPKCDDGVVIDGDRTSPWAVRSMRCLPLTCTNGG